MFAKCVVGHVSPSSELPLNIDRKKLIRTTESANVTTWIICDVFFRIYWESFSITARL